MKNKKILTALMAMYNAEKWVADSIESIINQTYEATQLCIINDASTDNSFEKVYDIIENPQKITEDEEQIVYEGMVRSRRVILINLKTNGRQGRARNFGIKYTPESTYYAIADSDDICMPDKYEKLISKIEESPGLVELAYADYYIHNVVENTKTYEFKEPFSAEILNKRCVVHSNCVFTKSILDKVGLFFENESPREDYGLFLRINTKAIMVHVPEPLTVVRITGKNSDFSDNEEFHKQQFNQMVRNFQEWLKE